MISDGLVMFLATSVFGIIGWAFRLEGRVSSSKELSDQQSISLEKLLDSKFEGVHVRLERIEKVMNGHYNKYPS